MSKKTNKVVNGEGNTDVAVKPRRRVIRAVKSVETVTSSPNRKITVRPATDEAFRKLESYLTKGGYDFVVRGGHSGNQLTKTTEELEVEKELLSLTDNLRVRMGKDEQAAINAGEMTRLAVMRAKIKELKAAAAKN